ncbi:hypothetical protein [Nocardiopsis sp. FR26]|uniref:hypothetical protein n=1 Tax=Nocardiopsis sp. FR26 TaxID=2605987 RepID=UPI001356E184|nr:hypothetical protein [Nocardiopsis sp. FR26]
MPELVLMWSAAVILVAVAVAALAGAAFMVAATVHGYLNRYRVRGLTREQIGECRNLAAQFRRQNGTANGPVSPPVDPVNQPKHHTDDEV